MLFPDPPSDVRSVIFRRSVGNHRLHLVLVTFVDYLTHVRLSRALRLLRESSATIAEVALTTGFADQSYFDRRFKSAFGKTPNQVRRSAEGQKATPVD